MTGDVPEAGISGNAGGAGKTAGAGNTTADAVSEGKDDAAEDEGVCVVVTGKVTAEEEIVSGWAIGGTAVAGVSRDFFESKGSGPIGVIKEELATGDGVDT